MTLTEKHGRTEVNTHFCKRITPEEILAAYKKTGLQVTVGEWAEVSDDGTKCACPMTALFIAEDNECDDKFGSDDFIQEVNDWSDNRCENADYSNGFVRGFDHNERIDEPSAEFTLGYEDGKAVRDALINEGMLT